MTKEILSLPFRHWPLKVLALFIGVALWYGIAVEDQVDTVLTVPLELRNLPASMIIANQYQKEVDVSVRGPKRLLQELRQQQLSRPVNLASARPGPRLVENTPDSFSFPRGVTVQRVQPANVLLVVDQLVDRHIRLQARTTGQPARGFTLEELQLKPDVIKVSGPFSLIGKVQSIDTATIDVEGLTQSGTVQVPLVLNGPLRKLIGEPMVEARILIREPVKRRTVQHIPITLRPAGKGRAVLPKTVSVDADIPVSIIKDTPELDTLFHASVNAAEADQQGQAPIRVEAVSLPGRASINIHTILPKTARLSKEQTASPEEESRQPQP